MSAMPAACMAASVPANKAMPTSADASAGASLQHLGLDVVDAQNAPQGQRLAQVTPCENPGTQASDGGDGLQDGAPTVTYCERGRRATSAALGAVVARQRDVHISYRSISDWATDGAGPTVRS